MSEIHENELWSPELPADLTPMIDQTDFPEPQYLDPRQDPQARDNPAAFWYGYGLFRQGKWYTDIEKNDDYAHAFAGWCFGFTEGKRWKAWWKSKFIWLAVGVGVLATLSQVNPKAVSSNPEIVTYITASLSVMIAMLRFVTKTAVH